MEDPEPEWKLIQCSKRMLTNGYVIGREIVMTGIVISSAPLVVPPLVAFSTMGFAAFSVPFGVLYASYACTNKLMSLLLPPTPMMLEYYPELGLDDDDDKESLVENWILESESYTDQVIEDAMDERCAVEDDSIASDDVFGDAKDVTNERSSEVVFGDDKDVGTVTDERSSEVVFGDVKDVGNITDERSSEVVFGDAKDVGTVTDERSSEVVFGDDKDVEAIIAEELGVEIRHVVTISGGSEDEDHSNANERNTNNNLEMGVGNEVEENVFADDNDAKVEYKSKDQENLDDDKIWEKIGAMRRIVGYKAPSQSTCIGELKALYVFTGVEPPEGDLDLHAKLKFLMAIVGVK